jgi:hypothetical protein
MANAKLADLIVAVDEDLPLSDEETALVEAIFFGEKADLGQEVIRAEVFRRLCMNAGKVRGGQAGRFRIEGGQISGMNLDLTGLNLDFGLQFKDTELPRLVLQDTRLLALELLGGSAARIDADRVEVAHDVVMGAGFTCAPGGAKFRSASIGGDFNCGGGSFLAKRGPSLLLDGTRIGGRLYLRRARSVDFQASGGVLGRNVRVAGAILCTAGRFEREVDFERAQVQGDFSLKKARIGTMPSKPGKKPDTNLVLSGMHITGELSLEETTFNGPKIDLARTRVDRSLRWSVLRAKAQTTELEVDLMQTKVGYLHDDLDRWHDAKVRLDGFSFDGVAVRDDDWLTKRKLWLKRQWDGKWSPHPYDQLRAALQRSGHESGSRAIAVEREDVRLERENLGGLTKWGRRIYGGLLGYGYKPFRFFVISAAIVLICALIFCTIDACDLPTNADHCGQFSVPKAGAPPYDAFLFSLDAFVPVDLGQAAKWQPRQTSFAYLVAFETATGWLFTALLLGAVTGILRRD